MGQKVNPIGYRLGINKEWSSKWYANKKSFVDFLHEDLKIKNYIRKNMAKAEIANINIERKSDNDVKITVFCAKPGIMIGIKGQEIAKLRKDLENTTKKSVTVNIEQIRFPDEHCALIAGSIAQQLEKRGAFRRIVKKAIYNSMLSKNVKGIKVIVSGRLGGAEMARTEKYQEGQVPLHTIRADIDYETAEAHTSYGLIGVKVWLYKGEIFREKQSKK
jgi:small subunit ribosomal protein S3